MASDTYALPALETWTPLNARQSLPEFVACGTYGGYPPQPGSPFVFRSPAPAYYIQSPAHASFPMAAGMQSPPPLVAPAPPSPRHPVQHSPPTSEGPSRKLDPEVRAAHWANKRYPGVPAVLDEMVNKFLCASQSSTAPDFKGVRIVVVPHAKPEGCGDVVASALRAIPANTERIVVIGPAHNRNAPVCSFSTFCKMETPLGAVSVDTASVAILKKNDKVFEAMPQALDRDEYCVETLIPFLQTLAPKASVLPIYVGQCPGKQATARGKILAKVIKGKSTVIVVTCDFGHWGEKYGWTKIDPDLGTGEAAIRATIARMDLCLIDIMSSCDAKQVANNIDGPKAVCGYNGLVVALSAAKKAGWKLKADLAAHNIAAGPDFTFQGHASIVFHDK